MPAKRRVRLSRSTSAASRMATSRAAETSEQRQSRMEQDRVRHLSARSEETSEQQQSRLEDDRVRHMSARRGETLAQRQVRLQEDRERHVTTRASESSEERQTRTENQRTRQTTLRAARWTALCGEAFRYNPANNYDSYPQFDVGSMNDTCSYCGALKWIGEAPGMCCCGGKVHLPALKAPPEPLESLVSGASDNSKHFLENIRRYNACFQMTSFGATNQVSEGGFMPTFKVQGQVYHHVGSLLPLPNEQHRFLQIYFMGDEKEERNQRCNTIHGIRPDIVLELQRMLHQHNNYVQVFKTALQRMPSDAYRVVIRADKKPAGQHAGRFNEPMTNEVAVVIVGNEFDRRDIVLEKTNNQVQRVAETHRSYDALQYPLIFWEGEDGYHFLIPQTNPQTRSFIDGKKVSSMSFYAYRLMVRAGSVNHILRCRQLFHQFVVDMYAKIESERLLYIRLNQKKLRVEEYIHLRDAVVDDGNTNNLGQLVILPSSFTGSPRHMHEYTQDAMTYVRNYGRPDLFITFTCSPKWEEIQVELLPGQTHCDRHDLTARVFRQKLIKLMDAITKGHVFGPTRCWMYSIEWQKRGLPHAHILVWLKDKIRPDQIDSIISAELPDPHQDPNLLKIVVKNMIHGPCGNINPSAPCMKDGKCTKRYPRSLLDQTQTGEDGYPLYRRRSVADGGFKVNVKVTNKQSSRSVDMDIDNRWIVPHCPFLSRTFQAHINVEYCNSVKSIKYICKYVNKGSDQAMFGLERDGTAADEVQRYVMGRYISSNEAVWRILDFPIHERHPTVVHLAVHLENGQRVYFTEENLYERVNEPPNTTLTAFFSLCQQDDFAKTLLYCDVPKYFTWNASEKKFKRRIQGTAVPVWNGIRSTGALGRVYTVHPNNFECFFLRLLLHTVRGPTSFADLRTVNGQVCTTFREACQIRGLLEADTHWDATMSEASTVQSPSKLRNLFAIMLSTCGLSNPAQLWESYKESMTEDILRQVRRQNPGMDLDYTSDMFNQVLIYLEDKVLEMSGKDFKQLGLPIPQRNNGDRLSREMLRETSYDVEQLEKYVLENEPLLVPDQRSAFNAILDLVNQKTGGIFFLDAPGGTGKTFVINLLLAKIRQQSKIAIAMASSGIAATLLQGGRTAHSTLKLPLNLAHSEAPLCNISKGTGQATVLQECALIVWDECTMSHKHALEALNRTLQDLRNNQTIMGGVVVLLAGDFRQTLPVIPRGTMADELKACLKASYLWRHVRKLELKTNMRVHLQGDVSAGRFAEQLLAFGDGKVRADPTTGLIDIPSDFCNSVDSIEMLKNSVFPNIQQHFEDHRWLCERAILAPRNDSVNAINLQIQQELPGQVTSYKSIDTVVVDDHAVQYPTEFLNSLEPPGIPPHNLVLKIGSPIMLLRNLDAPRLCNGTRLCVKSLMPHVIEATILTGCAKGEDVFIPRIPLSPTDMPFEFKRLQFPVRLAFAMSINKAQGQSLKVAGINLSNPCFSHGQLYVACSRVGTGKNLYVFALNAKTKNVVYQSALQ